MKFQEGDEVRVVSYGHMIHMFVPAGDGTGSRVASRDMCPELVGQCGVVSKISSTGDSYAVDGIRGKAAWFNDSQLEHKNRFKNMIRRLIRRF